jgi:hypothetical protein
MRKLLLCGAALAAFSLPTVAFAGTVASGFNSSTLAANDDGYTTSPVNIGFSVNYFGTSYTQLYVDNNGYVTFNAGQPTYTPFGLGSGYSGLPIIAPFFADVDTRGLGSGLTSWGTGTYAGETAFGVTWPAVGYFGSHTDKLNTFQLILTDRSDVGAGDFDIYFNYDQIQWETGDASGGSGGLGGTSAAAGYNAGLPGDPAGTYFQLLGSLVNGAFLDGGPNSLVTGTNDGTPGQFLFQVRNGVVVQPGGPPSEVPEPLTLSIFGAGLLGMSALRRRLRSK